MFESMSTNSILYKKHFTATQIQGPFSILEFWLTSNEGIQRCGDQTEIHKILHTHSKLEYEIQSVCDMYAMFSGKKRMSCW